MYFFEKGKRHSGCLFEQQFSACKIIQCLTVLHEWFGPQDPMMQTPTQSHTLKKSTDKCLKCGLPRIF